MTPLEVLKNRFADALTGLVESPESFVDLIRVAQDPKFGDFQANMAMPLAKKLGKPPRTIAAEIVERLRWDDLLEKPEIAGPGFINLRFLPEVLAAMVQRSSADERLGVARVEKPRTFIIDYSAPNAAKPMHVGHIRSTCIGRALYNILRFLGHTTISDNHLGDWGTQFGMIIYGYRNFLDAAAYEKEPVAELLRLYRLVRQKADADPEIMKAVLAETSKLHHGDEANRALWKKILPNCLDEIEKVYKRLGVTFDHTIGESFYNDRLGALVERLKTKGIARETEGAVGIFLDGEAADKDAVPMLIQKSDGAYLYATTDLATLEYRRDAFHPDAILYVVDFRQSHHFEQLFKAAKFLDMGDVELVHVKFGTVLGDDGKPFKTRSGDTVGLESLLDEAQRRAFAVVSANERAAAARERLDVAPKVDDAQVSTDVPLPENLNYTFCFENTPAHNAFSTANVTARFEKPLEELDGPSRDFVPTVESFSVSTLFDAAEKLAFYYVSNKTLYGALSEKERRDIAQAVGLGALVYADLSQNRDSDYVFSFDKMLAMNGNTATYMQYAYARIRSIFAKGNINADALRAKAAAGEAAVVLTEPAERALALTLLQFADALAMAAKDYRPNQLTAYLYELAGKYSAFFEHCPVLKAESEQVKTSRLILCDMTARTIQKGLELLGIGTVERM